MRRTTAQRSVGSDRCRRGTAEPRPKEDDMTDCAAKALSLFAAWEARDYDAAMAHLAPGALVKDMPRSLVLDAPSDIRDWLSRGSSRALMRPLVRLRRSRRRTGLWFRV